MVEQSNEVREKEHSARRDVAKGAGTVFLAKMGSAIELITQPAYTWMFGLATYGLYAVLWALVALIERIAELAMTAALQRILPKEKDEELRAGIVKSAFIIGILPCTLAAAIFSTFADKFAPLFNVAESDLAQLELAIAIFAWSLPLWAMLEITTGALRACKAFGPDIRLRLVWEQLIRFAIAIVLWLSGIDTLALVIAHLSSIAVTNVFALQVLNKHCRISLILASRPTYKVYRELLKSGLSVMPGNALARLFAQAPVIILNFVLPGAAGATASGLYAIARKLSSIPQLVRSVFAHVISPVASGVSLDDHHSLQALYTFSIRISLLFAVPTAAAVIVAADSLLALFVTGSAAAWPIVVILTVSRALQASLGPATAIQHVISHRGLPVLNSVIGLVSALVVLYFVFPEYESSGLALAVAIGQAVMISLPAAQLVMREKLVPFDGSFSRMLIGALASCVIIYFAGALTASFSPFIKGPVVGIAYAATLWLALRFALPKKDRLALGKVGRKLGFVDE